MLRLDEPDPAAAWDERIALLKTSSEALNDRRFDAIELSGPGTELTVGLLPTSHWQAGDFETRTGVRHLPNLPTEEVFTAPDPLRADGHVTSTKPLVLKDGTIVRGLRVRFEGGRAVEIDADEGAEALRAKLGRRRGRDAPRRARARRPPGPDRPARHGVLRHAARRERREPHRARRRLRVLGRRGGSRPAQRQRASTSTS